jgi:hypothetical protein
MRRRAPVEPERDRRASGLGPKPILVSSTFFEKLCPCASKRVEVESARRTDRPRRGRPI